MLAVLVAVPKNQTCNVSDADAAILLACANAALDCALAKGFSTEYDAAVLFLGPQREREIKQFMHDAALFRKLETMVKPNDCHRSAFSV